MKGRNLFNQSWSVTVAQVCSLLAVVMMFAFVTSAAGADATPELSHSIDTPPDSSALASASFDPAAHLVTVKAAVPVTAWDATANIGPHSLVVYENNVRQQIADVQVAHTPLSIGLLLENGGRYHAFNEIIAQSVSEAARGLMQAVDPADHVQIWTYADNVQALELPTDAVSMPDRTYLTVAVPPSSESNLYDALMSTIPRLAQMPGRRALIVVSSGNDSFSKANFSEVLQTASTSGVPVCVINIARLVQSALIFAGSDGQNPYAHISWGRDSARLRKLAEVSGCRALELDSSLMLPALYDELLGNLRLEYDIHYRPAASELPGVRRIRVEWVVTEGEEGITRPRRGRELARMQYQVDPAAKMSTQVQDRPAPFSASFILAPLLNARDNDALSVPMRTWCAVASALDSPDYR
jgi:hypothetical protein